MYWHHIESLVASSQVENVFLAKVQLCQVLESDQGSNCRTNVFCDHNHFLLIEIPINIFSEAQYGRIISKYDSCCIEGFISVHIPPFVSNEA